MPVTSREITWMRLKGSLGIDAFADFVLEKVLKDMAFYYDPERKIMEKNKKKQELLETCSGCP